MQVKYIHVDTSCVISFKPTTHLRTTAIDVNRVNGMLDGLHGGQQILGIAPAELRDEGPVGLGDATYKVPELVAVLLPLAEQSGVDHGRIGQVGPVPAAQEAKGQIGLVDHGRHDQRLAPEGWVGPAGEGRVELVSVGGQEIGEPRPIDGLLGTS